MALLFCPYRIFLFFRLAALSTLLFGIMAPSKTALAANRAVISVYKDDLYVRQGDRTRLFLKFSRDTAPHVFFIKGDRPRIVIDFKNAKLSRALSERSGGKVYFAGTGGIVKLRFARRGQKDMRFVADLAQNAEYLSHSFKKGVLEIIVAYARGGQSTGLQAVNMQAPPIPRRKPNLRSRIYDTIPVPRLKASRRKHRTARKPVIVIDPGHGGHDPGAIGAARVVEEHVVLKAAIELRRQLQASGKYKVVLTRTSDTYIDHDRRVLIARRAGADLFISLHADSLASSGARGASVYTLSSRAEARTHKIVSAQNWVLDVDLTKTSDPVGSILVDLAQRKTLTKSESFSKILIPELQKSSRLLTNTHRRAGYYVLLAPDVPAVLLEMGFLSNRQDEKLLNTAAHRKKLMASVARAIDTYFAQKSFK